MIQRLLIAVALLGGAVLIFALINWRQRLRISDIERERANGASPRILYFRSDHCASCAAQARLMQELDPKIRALIDKIDVDREPDQARRYDVLTLPTTVVVAADGTVKHINYGVVQPRRLKEQVISSGFPTAQGVARERRSSQ